MSRVAVLAGDGIGPEVTAAAVRVLRAAVPSCTCAEAPVGAAALASHGTPLPEETLALARASDAILFGAVGGPLGRGPLAGLAPEHRPEAAILGLRAAFGLYANLRPARAFAGTEHRSPLRAALVRGMDLVIVRELTGGLYFGPKRVDGEYGARTAVDTLVYHEFEIERIARFAFDLALTRHGRVTSVDKANVLVSSQLWREVVERVGRDYPEVALDHLLVDNAAMQLVRDPRAFDVIVTENMFGDILSDQAAAVAGSIGTAASASLGASPSLGTSAGLGASVRGFGLYEPIAGTAPDIAGRGIANPAAAILSGALLARHSLGEPDAAARIQRAVADALAHGPRTADLDDTGAVSTTGFTELVLGRLREPAAATAS